MAHWQEKIHPAEEDQFFLTEEHKHNFVSSFVWGATIHDLKPRLTDKEIEDRWNSYSSPSAKESALKRRDHEYEEYIISRAGIFDLEQQMGEDRKQQWIKAREFEEDEVKEWKNQTLKNKSEVPENDD